MNNRSYIGNMFIWLGIYMGIGLAISFVLPLPMSLLAMFGSLIGIDYLRARYMMKKMGITNIRQMFSSVSAPHANMRSSTKVLLHELWNRTQRNFLS